MKTERRPLTRLVAIAFGIAAVWFLVALFNTSEFYRRSAASGVAMGWVQALMFQTAVSMNWALFTPPIVFVAERFRIRKPHRLRNLLVLVALVVVGAYVRSAWGGVATKVGEGRPLEWDFIVLSVNVRVHRNAFIVAVIVGAVHLIAAAREAAAGEREAFELQADLANTELARLRLRLQPHLMAAAVREIRARMQTSPDDADTLLVKVARLLRRSIDLDRGGDAALRDELDFTDEYLEVENLRLGGRFRWRFEVADDELLSARMPTLLLHTIVAGVVVRAPGKVDLEISACRDDGLKIEVRATGTGEIAGDTLGEARMRLAQLFGRKETITTRRVGDASIVTLTLPYRQTPKAAA